MPRNSKTGMTVRAFGVAMAVIFVVVACACLFPACSGKTESVGEIESVSIELADDVTTVNLTDGETEKLNVDVVMSDGKEYRNQYAGLVWESSDESVATVSGGNVTAVAPGDAVIYCYIKGTGKYDTVTVRVLSDELLKVGVKDDVPGFGFYNDSTMKYEGMEIEMAEMLAYELYYSGADCTAVSSSEREDVLRSGEKDCVIATYSITDERRTQVNFSSAYYTDYIRILARDGYAADCASGDTCTLQDVFDSLYGMFGGPDDYSACRVGVDAGTTAATSFAEYLGEIENTEVNTARGTFSLYEIVEYPSYAECRDALENGEIDLFIADSSILSGYYEKGLTYLDDYFGGQEYGVGTSKDKMYSDSVSFTDAVNAVIDRWLADGTISSLLEKYGIDTYENTEA